MIKFFKKNSMQNKHQKTQSTRVNSSNPWGLDNLIESKLEKRPESTRVNLPNWQPGSLDLDNLLKVNQNKLWSSIFKQHNIKEMKLRFFFEKTTKLICQTHDSGCEIRITTQKINWNKLWSLISIEPNVK